MDSVSVLSVRMYDIRPISVLRACYEDEEFVNKLPTTVPCILDIQQKAATFFFKFIYFYFFIF